MPLASGCGPQAEPCGCLLSSHLRGWKAGEGPGLCDSICFPQQVKVSVSLLAAGTSIRLPRDHVQIQTGGKEAAAEHVFILSSWPPWEKGRQARQAQRWGVYRGTRLIVSPGPSLPQQVPRAFQPQSLHQQRLLLKPVPGALTGKRSPRALQAQGSRKGPSCSQPGEAWTRGRTGVAAVPRAGLVRCCSSELTCKPS